MDEAELVFTTLASSGRAVFNRLFAEGRRFDLVLIDEAAQARRHPNRRLCIACNVYLRAPHAAALLAGVLRARGYGPSRLMSALRSRPKWDRAKN